MIFYKPMFDDKTQVKLSNENELNLYFCRCIKGKAKASMVKLPNLGGEWHVRLGWFQGWRLPCGDRSCGTCTSPSRLWSLWSCMSSARNWPSLHPTWTLGYSAGTIISWKLSKENEREKKKTKKQGTQRWRIH